MNQFVTTVIITAVLFLRPDLHFTSGEQVDFRQNTPLAMIKTQMKMWDGIKCRPGFTNLSNEMVDAAYHCAGVYHERTSSRRFTDEHVYFSGPTPQLCQRACVIVQVGVVNSNYKGINETVLLELFKAQMNEDAAAKLTKKIMVCDKDYPTEFPKQFRNCKDTEDFLNCLVDVITDCSRKNQ